MRPLVSLVLVLVLGACSSPDKGFGEVKEVSAKDFGTVWPLTVESAKLNCNQGWISVFVESEGFRIDDLTRPADTQKKFLRYWATDESQPSGRMDLTPLVKEGESLCE